MCTVQTEILLCGLIFAGSKNSLLGAALLLAQPPVSSAFSTVFMLCCTSEAVKLSDLNG